QLATLDQAEPASSASESDSSQEPREASPDGLDELRSQIAQSRKLLNARASELKQLRSLLSDQANGVEGIDVAALLEQLSEIRLERDELVGRLADAERQGERAGGADAEHFDELQRRFEVAVQEIRELKAKNGELQRQASRGEEGSRDKTPSSTGFDWEQQKRRLMQQLDSDFADGDAKDKSAKLSIESTIRITDQVIAEKDRQIADLKAKLQDKADHTQENSSSELLDNDEVIRKERERLRRSEDECRGKLRQAEIDISVERAKLARERSELEAKLRSLEDSSGDNGGGKSASKSSGRWLSRLGLKDDEK
ncbi:MAG: hypothetical protein ABI614_21090, partial [Planctomycetota bacterium]